MTDTIVSVVLEQLASFVQQEVGLVLSVRKNVNDLISTLEMVRALLRDAETRQLKDELVKLWLEKLKDIVYDAEDVLDEWNTRTLNSQIQGVDVDEDGGVLLHKKVLFYLMSPCFSVGSILVHRNIGSRIKEIREHLDVVNHDKEQFKLNISTSSHEVSHERLANHLIDVPNTFGRERAKNDLVSLLLGESGAQHMNTNVISIVGTGGFGKTTLANLVLEEERVTKFFKTRIFVCVSEPFQLPNIAKSIIEQVTGNAPSVNERDPLLKCLGEKLKDKRFLIVLDDVWLRNPRIGAH